jgi:hypothetical protein
MRKIAILKMYGSTQYDCYGDPNGYADLVHHITDWEEICEDDFQLLKRGIPNTYVGENYRLVIIEHVENQADVICKTVSAYKTLLRKQEEDRLRYEAEALRKREEAKRKKEEKAKMTKEQKLKKLAEELGVEIEVKSK